MTQVPSGSFLASFPGCLSVSTALADDIKLCPTSQKGTVYLQLQFIPLE